MNSLSAYSLEGETALITGGATGLGFGIAQCYILSGAKVILVGRREEELKNAVLKLGEKATYITHDITKLEEANELVQKATLIAKSPISILVNNAGIHIKKLAVDTTPHDFHSVIQTHVFASHALSRSVLPGMIERKHGHILFMASMTSFMGMPQVVAYSAAKSAYLGMVRALASECSSQGVRVNGIAPGWIETPMLDKALKGDEARSRKILSRTPIGTFGKPEDIGWAASYLSSPAAKFITGVVLPVDGGASIGF